MTRDRARKGKKFTPTGPTRRKRLLVLLAPFLLLATLSLSAAAAEAIWKTRSFDDRSYVAFPDIAAAYGMTFAIEREDPKEIGVRGPHHSLVVREESRQALIDGVRYWLSFDTRRDDDGTFHISLLDVETVLVPAFDPDSVDAVERVRTIVFDPGHGGHDRGARSSLGVEKDYALDTVNRTRRILEERGHEVVQSRLTDFFAPLSDRPAMTKNYENPIFVSVHFNAAPWRPAASGFEVFAMPPAGAPSTGSDPDPDKDSFEFPGDEHAETSFLLAQTIYRTLLERVEGLDRGVKRARFVVLRQAKVPAILIEGGFLSNPAEAERIHSETWRERYATALADGIEAYIELANEGTPPPAPRNSTREPTTDFVPEG